MIIDNKGKFFGKISVVDICVVVVVIIGVLGAYFTVSTVNSGKFSDNSKLALNSSSPSVEANVTFKSEGVRNVTIDSLSIGDEVYETEDNKFIGTITDVTYLPAKKTIDANNGELFISEVPEKYDVEITVYVTGKNTETGFYTDDGVQILYGKEIEIKTPTVKTKPKVSSIKFDNLGEQ